MSIHSESHVLVLLSDYATADASGKLNAIGAGFQLVGALPTGMTPPMYLAILVDIPSRYVGDEFTASADLRNVVNNQIVRVSGPSGNLEPMRVQQLVRVDAATPTPGAYLPPGFPSRANMLLGFPTGLPLPIGATYRWLVEIDGHTRPGWHADFHVLGPRPEPVLGGQANDEGIEELPPLDEPDATG